MDNNKRPKGWALVKLGDVANFVNGRAFKPSEWESSGYPIIRIQNLTSQDSKFNYYASEPEDKYFVISGDLLVSWSATLGAFIWNGEKSVLNQHIFKVVENQKIIDKLYLYYIIQTKIEEMKTRVHGSTMTHIIKKDFDSIEIPIPPLPVQKRIVAILERAERLKEKRQKTNEETGKIIQSLFYEMFGDPVKNEKGWDVKALKDVCEIIMGQSPMGESYNSNKKGISFFQGKAEFGEKYPLVKKWTTEPAKFAELNDTLMSVRAPVGTVNMCNIKCCIGRGLSAIRPTKLNKEYLFRFLQSSEKRIEAKGTGSTFKAISGKDLKSLDIPVPPISLQNQFASLVEKIESIKANQTQSTEDINMLFDALMQKAFSGGLA